MQVMSEGKAGRTTVSNIAHAVIKGKIYARLLKFIYELIDEVLILFVSFRFFCKIMLGLEYKEVQKAALLKARLCVFID